MNDEDGNPCSKRSVGFDRSPASRRKTSSPSMATVR
jgi:hypothetical protein